MTELLPKSYYKNRKQDLTISKNRRILVLSDIHCPYHDIHALREAIVKGQEFGADTVILLGDLMDFHRISKYPNEPDTLSFADEITVGAQLIFGIREAFRDADIYYIEGNHEIRLQHYVQRHASELDGIPGLEMERMLDMHAQEVRWIPGGFIHCGDMTFLHGHEMRGVGGVNPSRKLFTKMKKSAMCGHLHRPESFYTRDGAGKLLQCHVVGHLGEPCPKYHPRNDWQHGYALVEVTRKGIVRVQNNIIE